LDKILITGAGGFIGSHLAELCVEQGFRVKAFVHYNSRNLWGWLEDSKHKSDLEVIPGDIRDFDIVHESMKGVDTVFHLAALIGIPFSYVSPMAYIKTNIIGTYNVLQSGKLLGTENILVTSTSETYGTAQYVPVDENHPMVGQSPYSATKIAADHLALSFYRSFGLPIKIVRPFNTYGPRQSARAIIPTIILQILNTQKTIKLGNLHPLRDFTFVKDTANGFVEIGKSDKLFGDIINIGMNEEISIGDLARQIADLMDSEIEITIEKERTRPDSSEVQRLLCDNLKIIESTNWQPKYSLRTGLTETIEWYRKNSEKYKPEIYNI